MFFNITAPFITIFIFYLSLCACFNINKIDVWDEYKREKKKTENGTKEWFFSSAKQSFLWVRYVFVNELYECVHNIVCACVFWYCIVDGWIHGYGWYERAYTQCSCYLVVVPVASYYTSIFGLKQPQYGWDREQ